MIDVQTLQRLPLFSTLQPEHVAVLEKNLRPLHIEAGEELITEESATRAPLFIVTAGKLEVTRKDGNGQAHQLALLDAPTVVGELEFLVDVDSSATVRAVDELAGFLLPRARFEALLTQGEPVAYHLALAIGKVVSERLAHTNRLLTTLLGNRPDRLKKLESKAGLDHASLAAIDAELDDLVGV